MYKKWWMILWLKWFKKVNVLYWFPRNATKFQNAITGTYDKGCSLGKHWLMCPFSDSFYDGSQFKCIP